MAWNSARSKDFKHTHIYIHPPSSEWPLPFLPATADCSATQKYFLEHATDTGLVRPVTRLGFTDVMAPVEDTSTSWTRLLPAERCKRREHQGVSSRRLLRWQR